MSYLDYPSLSSYISAAINLGLIELGFFAPKISLMRLSREGAIIYRSPLFIGQRWQAIYPHLISKNLSSSPYLDEEGWLEFSFTRAEFINWLDSLPALLTRYYPYREPTTCSDEFFFPSFRAYARCSSLLSLGHREGVIRLVCEDYRSTSWLWGEPQIISWQRCLDSGGGQKLLLWVLRVMDEWDDTPPLTLAEGLAGAFLDYQRYEFRLKGDRETVTARLGLIAIVHWLLRSLLTTKLALIPPSTL